MSKNDKRKGRNRLDAIEETLLPDVDEFTSIEVNDILTEAGVDSKKLFARVRERMDLVARDYRKRGKPAPRTLQALMDALDESPTLPKDPRRASEKARQWLQALRTPPQLPASPTILSALRKRSADAELSESDRLLLEKAAEDLKRKAKQDDEG